MSSGEIQSKAHAFKVKDTPSKYLKDPWKGFCPKVVPGVYENVMCLEFSILPQSYLSNVEIEVFRIFDEE